MSWHPPECQLTDKPPQALERALITGTRKCPRCRHRKQTKLPCHTRVRQEFPKLVMTSRSRRELLVLKEICAPSIRHMFFGIRWARCVHSFRLRLPLGRHLGPSCHREGRPSDRRQVHVRSARKAFPCTLYCIRPAASVNFWRPVPPACSQYWVCHSIAAACSQRRDQKRHEHFSVAGGSSQRGPPFRPFARRPRKGGGGCDGVPETRNQTVCGVFLRVWWFGGCGGRVGLAHSLVRCSAWQRPHGYLHRRRVCDGHWVSLVSLQRWRCVVRSAMLHVCVDFQGPHETLPTKAAWRRKPTRRAGCQRYSATCGAVAPGLSVATGVLRNRATSIFCPFSHASLSGIIAVATLHWAPPPPEAVLVAGAFWPSLLEAHAFGWNFSWLKGEAGTQLPEAPATHCKSLAQVEGRAGKGPVCRHHELEGHGALPCKVLSLHGSAGQRSRPLALHHPAWAWQIV